MEPMDSQNSQSQFLIGNELVLYSESQRAVNNDPQHASELSISTQFTFSSSSSGVTGTSLGLALSGCTQLSTLSPDTPDSQLERATAYAESLKKELEEQKEKAKRNIEELMSSILDSIEANKRPVLERPRILSNSKDYRRELENPGGLKTKIVFGKRSCRTFAMQLHVMSLVYRMIQQHQTSTIRDLYYENMNFFGNQNRLSTAIKELSLLLKVPREALCLEASAKGLVAGSLTFRNVNGDIIRASDFSHGLIVPNKLHENTITTNAQYILFVEKDATFQRLLEEKVFDVLGPIVMITGKGYPDMQTRRLICILNKLYNLRVYALVDCDPYGIEIAAVLKWGAYRNSNDNSGDDNCFSSDLSVPDLVWIGLLPSEQPKLSLTLNASAPLTDRDKKKLKSVTERIELQKHQPWMKEVRKLKQLGQKTELEALFSSPMFTSTVYLPSKLFPLHPNPNVNLSQRNNMDASQENPPRLQLTYH